MPLLASSTATLPALGDDTAGRSAAQVHVVGRLDTHPLIRREAERTTIVGVLTDEAGVPVAGQVGVLDPTPAAWRSCLTGASKTTEVGAFRVDGTGRFCLQAPALPASPSVKLRLSGESYRTRDLELEQYAQSAPRLRILAAPELVDLDGAEPFVVTARADGATAADDAELHVDCRGERTTLARAGAQGSGLRFEVAPNLLPGPGACAFVVRMRAESTPRPVVLQSRTTLEFVGWSSRGRRLEAIIQARLRWQAHDEPLDVGVLEGWQGSRHLFTAALAKDGRGKLEFEETPGDPISIRLARAPLYVQTPEALTLAPPAPWTGWHALEAAGLLGLGLWLVSSWRSAERKPEPSSPRPPTAGRERTKATVGRLIDAHTSQPISGTIGVYRIGMAAQAPVESIRTDDDGSFQIPPLGGLTRIRVHADGYLPFDGPLPAGAPIVRLVTRRRAALSLLAAWFRRGSRAHGPVPTPHEVRRSALSSGRPGVAVWAEEVARTAYGPRPPNDDDLSALAERKPS